MSLHELAFCLFLQANPSLECGPLCLTEQPWSPRSSEERLVNAVAGSQNHPEQFEMVL